jgi:hypothetical protein
LAFAEKEREREREIIIIPPVVKCQNDLHGNTKKDHFKTNKRGDHFFA